MNELMRKLLFLPEQASTMAPAVDHLHYFVIITTMIVSTMIGVAAVGFYVKYRWKRPHRRQGRAGLHDRPRRGAHHRRAGVLLPALVRASAIATSSGCRRRPPDAMDVYVMGKQWMWKFAYPEGPNGVNVLRVPADRPVRLLITSRDVIHSFFVPAFRIKQDALPGRYTADLVRGDEARHATRCSAPSTAAPTTRRCAPRSSSCAPSEFDEWLDRAARGRARASRTAPGPSSRSRDPHATMVEQGAAARRVGRAASSATPSTARRTSARPGWACTCARRRSRTARPSSPTRPTSPSR